MGRFRNSGEDDGETAIDMSPLIDCVFILLIFFIVTTVFVEEQGVEVHKPQGSQSESDQESNSILFDIRKSGAVMFEGTDVKVSGVQPIVKRAVARDPDTPVMVQSDGIAPVGLMVEVVGEAEQAGAKNVNISSKKRK